jgi:AbrB family looped-hinge helix DNA binding protein
MTKHNKKCCCNVESVVTVDERGQMVLPKEIRDKADIKAGDKLAVIIINKDDQFRSISLVKVESLSEAVTDMVGPALI